MKIKTIKEKLLNKYNAYFTDGSCILPLLVEYNKYSTSEEAEKKAKENCITWINDDLNCDIQDSWIYNFIDLNEIINNFIDNNFTFFSLNEKNDNDEVNIKDYGFNDEKAFEIADVHECYVDAFYEYYN